MFDLKEVNYNLTRYIKSSNYEQIKGFKTIVSKDVLNQVYNHLDKEDGIEDVETTNACLSILVDCTFLNLNVDKKIIPKIVELYKCSSHQPVLDILFQNLFVDENYTHILLENQEFTDVCLPIYICRGLQKLKLCIESKNTMKLEDDIMGILLDFVYIYMLNHTFKEVTKDIFHDCLYVLVNGAYCNYIQPEFIPLVTELYKTSYYPQTRYLILNYMYNVYHDVFYKKYLMQNVYMKMMLDFISRDCNKYPKFCKILENEMKLKT